MYFKTLSKLIVLCSAFYISCNGDSNNTLPDEVIYLDTLMTSPPPAAFTKYISQKVAVVEETGEFNITCEITDTGDTMYLIGAKTGRSNLSQWVKAEDYNFLYASNSKILKVIPDAYKVHIGTGRSAETTWLSGKNIYKAPWINIDTLIPGDTILIKRFGNFEPYKGEVTDTLKPGADFVSFKYADYNESGSEAYDEIFNIIEPAQIKDITPGMILYYNKMYWVMVIAIKDQTHIIVRQSGFPARDMIVPISLLQYLH